MARSDGAVRILLDDPCVVGFKGGEGSIEHFPARHNHDIQSWLSLESWSDLVAPEQLPRQALRAISTDGRPNLTACGHAQPRVGACIGNHNDGHEARVKSSSVRIRTFEFKASADALAGSQATRLGHRYPSSATVKRLRPLARRRFSTIRPFFVDIRTLKPCAFFRRRVFGWNVRFPFILS